MGAAMQRHQAKSMRARAVTLIEAVLFISIALGLIVGGLVFFQQASLAQRTSDTVRLVSALVTEARALGRSTGGGIDRDVLIAAGAVPSSAIDQGSGTIVSPWGGVINVQTPTAAGFPASNDVLVYLEDIPPRLCARIVGFDSETETGVMLPGTFLVLFFGGSAPDRTYISDKYQDFLVRNGHSLSPPPILGGLNPAAAGAACQAAGDDFNVAIGFWTLD
jgi:hypothetical protein